MSRLDRVMLSTLMALAMCLAPLAAARNTMMALDCCRAATATLDDAEPAGAASCGQSRSSCEKVPSDHEDRHESSTEHNQPRDCDWCFCCASMRAPLVDDEFSVPHLAATDRLSPPAPERMADSRSLRPDAPPPRV